MRSNRSLYWLLLIKLKKIKNLKLSYNDKFLNIFNHLLFTKDRPIKHNDQSEIHAELLTDWSSHCHLKEGDPMSLDST